MWEALATEYHHTSSYNILYQLTDLVTVSNQYEPDTPITDFTNMLELREIRLRDILKEGKRHDQDTEYRETLLKLLSFQQLKRDLLLGSIQRNRADLVDTLSSQGLRSEEHTSELQSRENLVCRLLLEK